MRIDFYDPQDEIDEPVVEVVPVAEPAQIQLPPKSWWSRCWLWWVAA